MTGCFEMMLLFGRPIFYIYFNSQSLSSWIVCWSIKMWIQLRVYHNGSLWGPWSIAVQTVRKGWKCWLGGPSVDLILTQRNRCYPWLTLFSHFQHPLRSVREDFPRWKGSNQTGGESWPLQLTLSSLLMVLLESDRTNRNFWSIVCC